MLVAGTGEEVWAPVEVGVHIVPTPVLIKEGVGALEKPTAAPAGGIKAPAVPATKAGNQACGIEMAPLRCPK